MKKGISLIVLVITIIVLAILAGAIIISLSNQNVITQASNAVSSADRANAKYAVTMAYAEAVSRAKDGKAYKLNGTVLEPMAVEDYRKAITDAGFSSTVAEGIVTGIDSTTYAPVIATN